MSESNSDKVKRFIEFNDSMIVAAMAEYNRADQSIHSKVLLCAIFDSLAKSRFPDCAGNAERFKRTIAEHSNWQDCERVSLLHLVRALEIFPALPPEFLKLNTWACDQFSRQFPLTDRLLSVSTPISKDPTISEVQAYWPTSADGNPKRLGRVHLLQLQHKNLLWLYRNSLIHEYRIPGQGWERNTSTENEPFYQQVATITELSSEAGMKFTNRWELIYPTSFFHQLTNRVLTSVADYHLKHGSSPFVAYSEGSYWIPDFNET